MRYALILGVAALLLPRSILANSPVRPFKPRPAVAQDPKLIVEVDQKAKVARLVIPRRFLNNVPAQPPRRGFGQLPTIMIGVALALSLAFSGLWLVRKRGGAVPLLVAAVAVVGLGSSALWADIGPRRPPVQPALPALPALATIQPIRVEVSPQGDAIRLIIPPGMQGQFAAPAQPLPGQGRKVE